MTKKYIKNTIKNIKNDKKIHKKTIKNDKKIHKKT